MTIAYRPDMTTEELRKAIDAALLEEVKRLHREVGVQFVREALYGNGKQFVLADPIPTGNDTTEPLYHNPADLLKARSEG